MNSFSFVGNLGADAKIESYNNATVLKFDVGTTAGYGEKKHTFWVRCAYWGKHEGLAPLLGKGIRVFVTGSVDLKEFTTRDGRQKSALEMRVSDVQVLGETAPRPQSQSPDNFFDED